MYVDVYKRQDITYPRIKYFPALIPCNCAAALFSPHAYIRSPVFVLLKNKFITKHTTTTQINIIGIPKIFPCVKTVNPGIGLIARADPPLYKAVIPFITYIVPNVVTNVGICTNTTKHAFTSPNKAPTAIPATQEIAGFA